MGTDARLLGTSSNGFVAVQTVSHFILLSTCLSLGVPLGTESACWPGPAYVPVLGRSVRGVLLLNAPRTSVSGSLSNSVGVEWWSCR